MKKIINGKTYDTDTARGLGNTEFLHPADPNYIRNTLYRTLRGGYFLHGEGGENSKYAISTGANSWRGGELIMPMTEDEARMWAEENLTDEEYDAAFGATEEAGDDGLVNRARITLSLDKGVLAKLRAASGERNLPMSQIVDQAVELWLSHER